MDKQFDELSKSLAEEGVSRREALRKFGIGLAAVLLAALGRNTSVLPVADDQDASGVRPGGKGIMKARLAILFLFILVLLLSLYIWYCNATMPYILTDVGPASNVPAEANHTTLLDQAAHADTPAANSGREEKASTHLAASARTQLNRYTNAVGQVAWSQLLEHGRTCERLAYLFSQGKTISLGSLGGKTTLVEGLNAKGHVIGSSMTALGERHAFLWEDGLMRDLGTLPGGRDSYALAINDRDQVIGIAQTETGDFHAFFWSEQGGMSDLGVLPRGTESFSCALNTKGQVVGWAINQDGAYHAVLWEKGKIADLNRLIPWQGDLVLVVARGINEKGQIRAEGWRHGWLRVFLLTPRSSGIGGNV